MAIWNPWHGCHKVSAGCQNCYVYRRDESIGKDAGQVSKTNDFDLPIKKNKNQEYRLTEADAPVYTCMTSDFFLKDADEWRDECWRMIRERSDLRFIIITKRIERFMECIPSDWGNGYENVTVFCTCENQEMADKRLPIFLHLPILHKCIIHEPMLGEMDIREALASHRIELVTCGGESGDEARPCHYDWVLKTRAQCMQYGIPFHFRQTGAVFIKDEKQYHIERRFQQSQAKKAEIDYDPMEETLRDQWLQTDIRKRLAQSDFRSHFYLNSMDQKYVQEKGMDIIRQHAVDFVEQRLAPADIPNDGKQTPMRGHPVFLAQHACACCCRGCLEKWHGIPAGKKLTGLQKKYIVDVLMDWINEQMKH